MIGTIRIRKTDGLAPSPTVWHWPEGRVVDPSVLAARPARFVPEVTPMGKRRQPPL